jgi:6-phosphofructokinase 1
VARVCRAREQGGQRFTIIAVAEGAKPRGGERAVADIVEDSPDPIRLGGIGKVLEKQLAARVESEVRTTILGHMQRGGTPSPLDRNLSTLYGAHAAALVSEGIFGRMVALQGNQLTSIALEDVAERTRTVPPDHRLVAAALAVGTSFGITDLKVPLGGAEIRLNT